MCLCVSVCVCDAQIARVFLREMFLDGARKGYVKSVRAATWRWRWHDYCIMVHRCAQQTRLVKGASLAYIMYPKGGEFK